MRRILLVLAAAALMAVMLAPGANAQSENFGGSENSTFHRNAASGQGNFGQCHQVPLDEPFVQGQQSSELHPGEADCRAAGGELAAGLSPGGAATAQLPFPFTP
jgi:hypothetical protein